MPLGKIARLPHAKREQLNERLENHELGQFILDWLNALPEVREILAAQFDSQPISKQNLSQWRRGGFRAWQARRESLKHVPKVLSEAAGLEAATGAPVGDTISNWSAVQYLLTARDLVATGDNGSNLKILRTLLRDSLCFQRGGYRSARMKFEYDRLDLFEKRDELKKIRFAECLWKTASASTAKHPESKTVIVGHS